jgi:hypothetical protein
MPADRDKPSVVRAAGRPPHPATVAQRSPAVSTPAPRPPHSATVAQKKPAIGTPTTRPPHPATVAQPRPSPAGPARRPAHPATVAQPSRVKVDMTWIGVSATIAIKEGNKTAKYAGSYHAKSGGSSGTTPAYFDFKADTQWPIDLNIKKMGSFEIELDSGKTITHTPYTDFVGSTYQFISRSGKNLLRLTFNPKD